MQTKSIRWIGAYLLACACGNSNGGETSASPGAETGPCVEGQCLGGLQCLSDVCVDPGENTTSTADPGTTHPATTSAGTTDSGATTSMSSDTASASGTDGATATTTDGTTATTTDGTTTATTDDTTTTGAPAVCGDGVKAGDEECDDGNAFDGDGCTNTCVAEPIKYGILTVSPPTGIHFHVCSLLNDWSCTLVTKEVLGDTRLTPAVSDQHVYVLSEDAGGVHRYGLYTGAWTSYAPDPPAIPGTSGFMQWVGNGVCLGYWNIKEVHCYDGMAWRKIDLGIVPDRVATWDPATNQLYVKTLKEWGFQVIDLDTDQIVNTMVGAVHDSTELLGAYSSGYFFTSDGYTAYKIHTQNGGLLDLMIPLSGWHPGGDIQPDTGKLFVVNDNNDNAFHSVTEFDLVTLEATVVANQISLGNQWKPFLRFQRPAGE